MRLRMRLRRGLAEARLTTQVGIGTKNWNSACQPSSYVTLTVVSVSVRSLALNTIFRTLFFVHLSHYVRLVPHLRSLL